MYGKAGRVHCPHDGHSLAREEDLYVVRAARTWRPTRSRLGEGGVTVPRVLVIGEDTPGSLFHSYLGAFRSLGVHVEGFASARGLGVPGLRRLQRPAQAWLLNRRLRAHAMRWRGELVVVLKGEALMPETIDLLRRKTGAAVVNFYPDDPFSDVGSNRPMFGIEVLARYDACFTFARHLVPAYRAVGVAAVHYLPFARDPALHAPLPPSTSPEFDVVFAGNLDGERIAWLEALRGFRVAIFGERTRSAVPRGHFLRDVAHFPAAYGPALASALARGAISLNVMRRQNRLSHNMRSFESPACGAFTLSQRTPELGALFDEGREVACFGSADELRAAVAFWLTQPRRRQEVAAAGTRRVAGETYARRADLMMTAILPGAALEAPV
jgi:hypothetical protein